MAMDKNNTRRAQLPGHSLALGALACGLLAYAGCSRSSAPEIALARDPSVPVTTAIVESVSLDRTLPVVGTLFPRNEATIAAQVEGQVQKTTADFGDHVAAGRELALIDTDSYEALAVQAAAAVAKAKASALNAQQNLKR